MSWRLRAIFEGILAGERCARAGHCAAGSPPSTSFDAYTVFNRTSLRYGRGEPVRLAGERVVWYTGSCANAGGGRRGARPQTWGCRVSTGRYRGRLRAEVPVSKSRKTTGKPIAADKQQLALAA